VRKADVVPYLRPDGKTQVSVRYCDGVPVEIENLLISTQHREGAESLIPDDLWEHVVEPILPKELYDAKKLRKAFWSTRRALRDRRPSRRCRPDRAQDHRRHVRRHGPSWRRRVQRQGPEQGRPLGRLRRALRRQERGRRRPGDRCEVQVAYAIGVAHPVSVYVETFGTEKVGRGRIAELVDEHFDLRPGAFPPVPQAAPADLPEDRRLWPLRPRGRRLHLGADDKADALRAAAGLSAEVAA
jgi:S-adenosylmethionine synthetase